MVIPGVPFSQKMSNDDIVRYLVILVDALQRNNDELTRRIAKLEGKK